MNNSVDAPEGQDFVLGDEVLMDQNLSTFTKRKKKEKFKGSKCYSVLSCIKSNKPKIK